MDNKSVKDLMVPVTKHLSIPEDATLLEAIQAINPGGHVERDRAQPRDILIISRDGKPLGLTCELDILRGLEPGYRNLGDLRSTSLSGMSGKFLKSMLERYNLWQDPLGALCEKAASIHMRELDYTTPSDHCVTVDDSLNQATHLMVTGEHSSLFVKDTAENEIVGVLHRHDVYMEVCDRILACGIKS